MFLWTNHNSVKSIDNSTQSHSFIYIVISPCVQVTSSFFFLPLATYDPEPTSTAESGRSLHSSTFRLNVSAFCGIGGAFRGYLGGACEVLRGNRGDLGCILF